MALMPLPSYPCGGSWAGQKLDDAIHVILKRNGCKHDYRTENCVNRLLSFVNWFLLYEFAFLCTLSSCNFLVRGHAVVSYAECGFVSSCCIERDNPEIDIVWIAGKVVISKFVLPVSVNGACIHYRCAIYSCHEHQHNLIHQRCWFLLVAILMVLFLYIRRSQHP